MPAPETAPDVRSPAFRADAAGTSAEVSWTGGTLLLDGARSGVPAVGHDATLFAVVDGATWAFELPDPLAPPAAASNGLPGAG